MYIAVYIEPAGEHLMAGVPKNFYLEKLRVCRGVWIQKKPWQMAGIALPLSSQISLHASWLSLAHWRWPPSYHTCHTVPLLQSRLLLWQSFLLFHHYQGISWLMLLHRGYRHVGHMSQWQCCQGYWISLKNCFDELATFMFGSFYSTIKTSCTRALEWLKWWVKPLTAVTEDSWNWTIWFKLLAQLSSSE